MARTRTARRSGTARTSEPDHLEALAILLLADARDAAEELTALAIALLAHENKRNRRSKKYGPRGPYDRVKSADFFEIILYHASDRWFRAWLRVSREGFWHVHDLIQDDPIFVSTGSRPQRPVWHQLAVFLCRMGHQTAVTAAGFALISEGCVHLYTDRVCRAVRNIRNQHVFWPRGRERDEFSAAMSEWGFPGCLGSGDGTYIRFEKRPSRNGYAYWCRKKIYAIVIQATVDHRGQITSYDFSWPGSVQDSRVFRSSHLWLNRRKYFRRHEYILVDKGYPLTKYSIRPFNDHDLTNDPDEAKHRRRFNRKLSSLRIFVEHAFGRLKGRFPILRCMPGYDVDEMYRIIEALIVLHNILERLRDDPTDIEGFNGEEDEGVDLVRGEAPAHMADEFDPALGEDELYRTGLLRRKYLLNMMVDE